MNRSLIRESGFFMGTFKEKNSRAFDRTKGKADNAKKHAGHKLEDLKDKTHEIKDRADNETEKLRIKAVLKKRVEDKVWVLRERRKAKANKYWRMLDDVTVSYNAKRLLS